MRGNGQHPAPSILLHSSFELNWLSSAVGNRCSRSKPVVRHIQEHACGLVPDTNLKPDGISIIPWTSGKPLAWDVTCAHPLAQSWTGTSRRGESAVATAVEAKKRSKYKDLENNFHFEPVSMETLDRMGETTALYIKRLGKRIFDGTRDTHYSCLLYTSPSPRDGLLSRMPSSA